MKNADISNCGGDFLLMAIFSKLYNQLVSFPKQLPSSVKKLLLKISQIQRKTSAAELFFKKVAGLRPTTLLKKKALTQIFS